MFLVKKLKKKLLSILNKNQLVNRWFQLFENYIINKTMKLTKKKIFLLVIISLLIFFVLRLFFNVQKDLKINYFDKSLSENKKILEEINIISKSLHNKNYWLTWGHWWELLAHTFYWYSLTNLYLENLKNTKFQKFAKRELEFILNYIKTDWKKNFINKNTDIPLWIIYQWHKNQILASLVLIWENKYKETLYENSDFLYKYLNKTKSKNCETYAWRSWYVDNINAIYSLYLTDEIRKKDNLKAKYNILIKDWLVYMKKNLWKNWMILAETTWPELQFNQSRWASLSWTLVYLYDLDKNFFNKQYKLYKKYLFSKIGLSFDIPKWQTLINKIPAWPVVFWYSSSASILSLWIFKKSWEIDYFYKNLKAIDYAYFYNWKEYIFWKSTLIDSLALWGKTQRF